MKRFLWLTVLAACMLLWFASAGETEDGNCLREKDEGPAVTAMIRLLKDQGWLAENHAAGVFDEDVTFAIMAFQEQNGLEATGYMDDETLTLLIWGLSVEELNEAISDNLTEYVWLPTHGGQKFHADETCSGMIEPRIVTARNAIALGVSPCRKCAKAYENAANSTNFDLAA